MIIITPVSEAQKRAISKYTKANYDEIKVRVPKGSKDKIQEHASNQNESTSAFINRAINETMERDTSAPADTSEETQSAAK